MTFFASGQAYDFLAPRYASRESSVRVYPIAGMRFHYNQGRLALTRSIVKGIRFWTQVTAEVDHVSQLIKRQQPDLVITDFEPILSRAAERMGVPYMSLDHQHMLSECDLSALPWTLRSWAALMSVAVSAHYRKQQVTVVTSFSPLPVKKTSRRVLSLGPIVRSAIANATPHDEGYLVSYLRRHTPQSVLDVLATAGHEVRVYGLTPRPQRGNMVFRDFDPQQFAEDLAGCRAMVGAAGNQSLGEALYLGKPVLALPESRHHEQRINAFYLKHLGFGDTVTLSKLRADHLQRFLGAEHQYRQQARRIPGDALELAIATILQELGDSHQVSRLQVA